MAGREPWRLITTWGADPGFNMGLDEALLELPDTPPTLRLYSWSPDTLSLGYFQRFDDVRGTGQAGAVVRRITGGGAIHHQGELTFSISVPQGHALYRGNVGASYERVHAAIARALEHYELEAAPCGARTLLSDRSDTGMCFHASTPFDLVWDERKGLGSAQRRSGRRILHHGSIKLESTPLEGDIATVSSGGRSVSCTDLAPVLIATFEREFDLAFEVTVPDADERGEARRRGLRYLDPAFVKRR